MKFYCWRADGDHNQVDNRAHEANSPAQAAELEAAFKAHFGAPDLQHIWVQWLDGDEERIALVAVRYKGGGSTSALNYGASVHFTTRLRYIEDAGAWHREMAR